MQVIQTPQAATKWCEAIRARGLRIGFVPTMGALHRGHLSLAAAAVRENDATCASIFVNPLQFERDEDLRQYPSDFAGDVALLKAAGCQMVFTGTLPQFFPESTDASAIQPVDPGPAAHKLEGEYRPGHLQGVAAIVARLFAAVGNCTAYFGSKDFQQTLVVQHIAQDFPGIRIAVCPTIREPSGLALSSRNRRLNESQLATAAVIYRALSATRDAYRAGNRDIAALESLLRDALTAPGLRVEYAAVRDWQPPRALVAAYVGEVRLIDNLALG